MARWHSVASLLVCSLYGATTAYYMVVLFKDNSRATYFGIGGFFLGLLLSRARVGRDLLKMFAIVQLVTAALVFKMFFRETPQDILHFIAVGVTIPAAVLPFGGIPKTSSFEENLPAGYEHVVRHSKPLSALHKLGLVGLATAILPIQMFSGVLFAAILVAPVMFAARCGLVTPHAATARR